MTSYYEATVTKFIGIDEDEKGLFVTIPSEKDMDVRYELRCEESDTSVEVTSCSCKGHQYTGHCKHREIVQGMWDRLYRSNAIKEAAKQEASKPVATAETYTMSDELCEKLKKLASLSEKKLEEKAVIVEETTKKVVEIHGNLNGAQQSASFFANLPSRQKIAS
jgi:hypothetical protein